LVDVKASSTRLPRARYDHRVGGTDEALWQLTFGRPYVDATELAAALAQAAATPPQELDVRTRLLMRDSLTALRGRWGEQRTGEWLRVNELGPRIERIVQSVPADETRGFPTLSRRIVDAIRPETVFDFLGELGQHVTQPSQLVIGGSIALMLDGYLARSTEDVDVVDELPPEVRSQHALIDELERRFGLRLAHFQSHYLPDGWDARVRSVGVFGVLAVQAVDRYDVVLSKLFSNRTKDRDDLRTVRPKLDRPTLDSRLRETCTSLLADERLRKAAEQNWSLLFREPLPG
jgi:hypothetical protein